MGDLADQIERRRQQAVSQWRDQIDADRRELYDHQHEAADTLARHERRPQWVPALVWRWARPYRRRRWMRWIEGVQ